MARDLVLRFESAEYLFPPVSLIMCVFLGFLVHRIGGSGTDLRSKARVCHNVLSPQFRVFTGVVRQRV
jgi:hypothetical protein